MNGVEKKRAAQGRRALVETFDHAYEESLRKKAQDAAPDLLDELIVMAKGTQYERDEDGVVVVNEDGVMTTNGPRIPLNLQRGAINDVLEHAKPPKEEALPPGGAGGALGAGARFYIKEIHFAPQADTPESVLANATVVEAVAVEAEAAVTAATADDGDGDDQEGS